MRADHRNQQQRGGERPDQRSGRRDRVQPSGDRTRVGDAGRRASRLAYGATAPSSITGTATSTSTAASDPRNPPTDSAPSAFTDSRRNGSATNGTSASSAEATSTTAHSPRRSRAAIGEPAADRIPDRQRHEHGRDRVRPDDRRGPEVRRQQARRRDLGAEARGADDEHDEPQLEGGQAAAAQTALAARRCASLPASGAVSRSGVVALTVQETVPGGSASEGGGGRGDRKLPPGHRKDYGGPARDLPVGGSDWLGLCALGVGINNNSAGGCPGRSTFGTDRCDGNSRAESPVVGVGCDGAADHAPVSHAAPGTRSVNPSVTPTVCWCLSKSANCTFSFIILANLR